MTRVAAGKHPLCSLGPDEIRRAAEILRTESGLGEDARFVSIVLHEPHKSRLGHGDEHDLDRQAFIVLRDRARRTTHEAVVSLTDGAVVSFEEIEGVQAAITSEEFMRTEEVVFASPEWRAAVHARGIDDVERCMLDPWSAGWVGPMDDPSLRRICRPLTWVRGEHADDNGYARPIEGLQVVVDLDAMEVIEVVDHGVTPLPPLNGNYVPELMLGDADNVPRIDRLRDDLRPIQITQPEGPSFTIEDGVVAWQKWQVRIGFNGREGLVLYDVAYRDGERLRPIIHRASISEMYIPYADRQPTQSTKNVFDMGEYGLGWLANSLQMGCDCLGEIRYLDGVVNDQDGNAMVIPNAICIHEEDAGIGWKHTDFRTERAEVRRRRRLVISMIVTVGNYEYGFYWQLYTDGTFELLVKLLGCLTTNALPVGGTTPYGQVLAPGLYGPHHQHFFNVRLDTEVDGRDNRVVEVDAVPEPLGPDNPLGGYWRPRRTVLANELAARRSIEPRAARVWRIESASARNAVGEPTAYTLTPGHNAFAMADPEGVIGRRGGFIGHHLWVTQYDPSERFAAGDYPNQHPGGAGLPTWVQADRPLDGEDLVLWYTVGCHHMVRTEDWPVMPVIEAGFQLRPTGFFDANPALDLPREPGSGEHGHCH